MQKSHNKQENILWTLLFKNLNCIFLHKYDYRSLSLVYTKTIRLLTDKVKSDLTFNTLYQKSSLLT